MTDYNELHPDWLEADGIARIRYKMISIIRDEAGKEVGREAGCEAAIQTMAAQYDSNLALAQAEAWPGSITIERCLLYTSPSPRDPKTSRMPSSA